MSVAAHGSHSWRSTAHPRESSSPGLLREEEDAEGNEEQGCDVRDQEHGERHARREEGSGDDGDARHQEDRTRLLRDPPL